MYKVALTKEEREELKSILKKRRHAGNQYRDAWFLLNVEEGNDSNVPGYY